MATCNDIMKALRDITDPEPGARLAVWAGTFDAVLEDGTDYHGKYYDVTTLTDVLAMGLNEIDPERLGEVAEIELSVALLVIGKRMDEFVVRTASIVKEESGEFVAYEVY
jgi:hypothetical protein